MILLIVHIVAIVILLCVAYDPKVIHSKWSRVSAFFAGFGALSAMQNAAELYVGWVFAQ